MSEPTMPSERVSRERREAVAKAIYGVHPQIAEWEEPTYYGAISRESVVEWESLDEYLDQVKVDVGEYAAVYRTDDLLKAADATIQTILPDRTAFFDAVDELVDVIKGFEPDSTIEDKKIALRDLVYGADDASGGTR